MKENSNIKRLRFRVLKKHRDSFEIICANHNLDRKGMFVLMLYELNSMRIKINLIEFDNRKEVDIDLYIPLNFHKKFNDMTNENNISKVQLFLNIIEHYESRSIEI